MTQARAGGILLPVSALPGPYGIGTLGRAAYEFVDFLAAAGQKYWQILPLVPLGAGNSPYMSPSSFAGNPLLIDLAPLYEEGLLTKQELQSAETGSPDRVDYGAVRENRDRLFHLAWTRGRTKYATQLLEFLDKDSGWLADYALFMALQDHFQGKALHEWPEDIRLHTPKAVQEYSRLLADASAYHAFLQLLFFRQGAALRAYANEKGISIIGDLPIYVSPCSAEVWSYPELFLLDDDLTPSSVAGVPPDLFSSTGQYWGNPLYNWPHHKTSHYGWWRRRGMHMARLYDVVRIDHFRGLHSYWSIPKGADTAAQGHWEQGPGMELVDILKDIPGLSLIAEDLGDLDSDARAFITASGLPGMTILVYAFDPSDDSAYLPHNCGRSCVMYTGTHDTATFIEWLFGIANEAERAFAMEYLNLSEKEGFAWGAVRAAWASPAQLAIAPMQDLLGLGGDARTNTPGTTGPQNWSWRVRREALNPAVSRQLLHLTQLYRRGG